MTQDGALTSFALYDLYDSTNTTREQYLTAEIRSFIEHLIRSGNVIVLL